MTCCGSARPSLLFDGVTLRSDWRCSGTASSPSGSGLQNLAQEHSAVPAPSYLSPSSTLEQRQNNWWYRLPVGLQTGRFWSNRTRYRFSIVLQSETGSC